MTISFPEELGGDVPVFDCKVHQFISIGRRSCMLCEPDQEREVTE